MQLNPAIPIHALDPEVLIRLAVATLLGALLGLDREARGNPAGLRTHAFVCVAAATMTVSLINLSLQLDAPRADPLRVFEATGAFVGFIGAGLIVFSRGRIRNLTTAAHLWLTAVIGIACGAGQWPLVAVTAVISLVVLVLLQLVEGRWSRDRDLRGGE